MKDKIEVDTRLIREKLISFTKTRITLKQTVIFFIFFLLLICFYTALYILFLEYEGNEAQKFESRRIYLAEKIIREHLGGEINREDNSIFFCYKGKRICIEVSRYSLKSFFVGYCI